jgi:phospholipid/cholesterol/gamma-HCH transport system permease protein
MPRACPARFDQRLTAVDQIPPGVGLGELLAGFPPALSVFTTTADMNLALFKAVIYGAIVAIVSCEKGLTTRGGSMAVANSVNAAVVESILLLMLVNVAISQMYLIFFPQTGL